MFIDPISICRRFSVIAMLLSATATLSGCALDAERIDRWLSAEPATSEQSASSSDAMTSEDRSGDAARAANSNAMSPPSLYEDEALQSDQFASTTLGETPPDRGHVTADSSNAMTQSDGWSTLLGALSLRHEYATRAVGASRRPKYDQRFFDSLADDAQLHLGLVLERVLARGMPAEIALIPFVESKLDPTARSASNAAGLWQIMPATGRRFGLNRDYYRDARLDPAQSTRAALDYIELLNRLVGGDWLLTIAAYNSGEGTVLRTIKKTGTKIGRTSYWDIRKHLPRETRSYIPKWLRLAKTIAARDSLGLQLPPFEPRTGVASIDTGGAVDLAVVAERTEIALELLKRLNPAILRHTTHPEGPYRINVPIDEMQRTSLILAELEPGDRIRTLAYQVRRGDTLSAIALRHGSTVGAIQRRNSLADNRIVAGRSLMIPLGPEGKGPVRTTPASATVTVAAGDSLWMISRRAGTTVGALRRANNLDRRTLLKPGEVLTIPTRLR